MLCTLILSNQILGHNYSGDLLFAVKQTVQCTTKRDFQVFSCDFDLLKRRKP